MENKVKVGFKKVHPDAKLPTYAHEGDAGMDVYAAVSTKLRPYEPTIVRTGLVAEIPKGYELQIRSRSGLAAKQAVFVLNGIGTIDQGYKGEIGVILFWAPPLTKALVRGAPVYGNTSCLCDIDRGMRIAQFVLAPVTTCQPVEVQEVSVSVRGEGGFGSTGR